MVRRARYDLAAYGCQNQAVPGSNKRQPYPISWEEQARLFKELPDYLEQMALFAVNTGLPRRRDLIFTRKWEVEVKQLDPSVCSLPEGTGQERRRKIGGLKSCGEFGGGSAAGRPSRLVFTYEGHPINRMLTSGWLRARIKAGLPQVRVHDLKHTFGRRLRAAGVSFEDRQDLWAINQVALPRTTRLPSFLASSKQPTVCVREPRSAGIARYARRAEDQVPRNSGQSGSHALRSIA